MTLHTTFSFSSQRLPFSERCLVFPRQAQNLLSPSSNAHPAGSGSRPTGDKSSLGQRGGLLGGGTAPGSPSTSSLPSSHGLNHLKKIIRGSLTFLQILIYTQE